MHKSLLFQSLPVLGFLAFGMPMATEAQLREVISKEVSVGGSEAELRLEFSDDGQLEITLADGVISIDGDVIGRFDVGDELDAAWRSLLGSAVALDDGPLAAALHDWTLPAELAGELADIAREIDRALETALTAQASALEDQEPSVSISIGSDDAGSLMGLLLGSLGQLGVLEEALSDLDSDFRLHVQEDVQVDADELVEGTLVVVQGHVTIEGEVDGDLVVIDGTLELLEGSRVNGEVRIADTRILRNQGTVQMGLVDLLEEERDLEAEIRDRLREELRDELRSDLRSEIRNVTRLHGDDASFSFMSPVRAAVRGVGGVVQNLVAVFILGLIGMLFVTFAGENFDTIAETAARAPGRSAMVGFAGSFLLVPVYILGVVALAVSIVGIPVAIAWLPLFPMAAAGAALVGYLAVARNAGEWLADSGYPWTGWIRKANPVYTVFGGVLGLMFAFIAANVFSVVPLLGFVNGLLTAIGGMLTFFAIQIGFGAVLLTRAGRRRAYRTGYGADAAWEAAMSVDVDDDVEPEPTTAHANGDVGSEEEEGNA